MAARLVAVLAAIVVVLADHAPHGGTGHHGPPASTAQPHRPPAGHSQRPVHRPRQPVSHSPRPSSSHRPTYGPQYTRPTYRPPPTYTTTIPTYGPQHHGPQPHGSSYGSDEPTCAATSPKPWCLEDKDYPTYAIQASVEQHKERVLSLYADVADLSTELSVDLTPYQKDETYLCPSEVAYVRPLRAVNTDGKWRIIVNGIKVHYETLTQTVRLEECLNPGYPCPLVPQCYESKCLQKFIYHRFLVYDPYDQYFPFAVETFKLPASCACLLGASTLEH